MTDEDMERAWQADRDEDDPMTSQDRWDDYDMKGSFEAGWDACLKRNKPIAVEDIPEEWKDGRKVIVMRIEPNCDHHHRTRSTRYSKKYGWNYLFNRNYWPATHAMLPPSIEP